MKSAYKVTADRRVRINGKNYRQGTVLLLTEVHAARLVELESLEPTEDRTGAIDPLVDDIPEDSGAESKADTTSKNATSKAAESGQSKDKAPNPPKADAEDETSEDSKASPQAEDTDKAAGGKSTSTKRNQKTTRQTKASSKAASSKTGSTKADKTDDDKEA